MTIIPTLFKEVLLIKTVVHSDMRGSFSEHFSELFYFKFFPWFKFCNNLGYCNLYVKC